MHPRADAIVAAARGCLGTRFRLQGRVPGTGLDCVGVALVAAAAAGCRPRVPTYGLGGDNEARLDAAIAAIGATPVADAEPGDILVLAPRRHRRHLAVVTWGGIVHAHAGLGRVVEGPADPAWSLVAAWRLPED
ncbi:MAG: peptidoglycan endopeptidase [Sphingomonadaceae bacterium]|nr:peptidoglycan endopeptidase [Sphingomonadaceae bacterium]